MTAVITDETTGCSPDLQPLWHHKAPRPLVEGCPAEDLARGWKAWQDHLRARKKPLSPPFLKEKKSPLLWGWPQEWERAAVDRSIHSPTTLAEIVIGDDPAASPDITLALQTIALAYAMPKLAHELPAEAWWQLMERLREVAIQAQTKHVDWPGDAQAVLHQQLLAGELPLALSYLFPEVRVTHALRTGARESLSEAMLNLTDGQGLPDARLLPMLGPLFACWTRARWIGSQMKRGPWSPEAEVQFQWLVRHAIRLADKGGRFVLASFATGEVNESTLKNEAWDKNLFATAIRLAGDRGDRAAASVALPHGVLCKHFKADAADLPRASLNSDWSGITIMAGGWSQNDTRLATAYVAAQMTIELSVGGEKLLSGLCDFETECNGKPVHPTGDWEQLCWERGKRFNLVELGRPLSDGLRLERQILLACDDNLLYFADAVISREKAGRTIRHSLHLPLAHDICWQPEAETRDGVLVGKKIRAAVLPLALSEWRSDPRSGTLDVNGGRLVLTQETNGVALGCPVVIDLDRKRATKPRTWRQLTVGENLEIVPRDVAVGYRAQSGDDQWLVYRSLAPAGNRTVLGQNFAGEFSAGRFLSSGKFKQWIEIEAV
jgi:hypothetical protein